MAVNVWLRMFFYGLHGFFDEILFTSLFSFVESNFLDWRFRGHSSLWSFFMYGFGSFVIERLYLRWKDKWYLPMPVRATMYVLWVYLWEFSCGMVLRYGLPLGLQQSPVELVWLDNFAVFPCLVCCKCVSRICCGISSNAFQRHKSH